ncbi:CRISPR-associated endonuclease Cas9 [Bienertia sinuspersici]
MRATGRFFTWSNKQEGDKRVLSEIDRARCNKSCCSTFQTAETLFLHENSFDHTYPAWEEAFQIMHKLRALKSKLKNMQKDDAHTNFHTARSSIKHRGLCTQILMMLLLLLRKSK